MGEAGRRPSLYRVSIMTANEKVLTTIIKYLSFLPRKQVETNSRHVSTMSLNDHMIEYCIIHQPLLALWAWGVR